MYGLYAHIPFCRQLCPYCDFAVAIRKEPPHDAYCEALLVELKARRDEHPGAPHTVYLGGGTPSLWSLAALGRFLGALDLSEAVEVTIEANPLDVTPEVLEAWVEIGITRVSLGVQSLDDAALEGIGRDHDGERARRAAEWVTAAGVRSSFDLIYGGPAYDPSVVQRVCDLRPDHISAYELTIEQGTVFARRLRTGRLVLPAEDDVVQMGERLVEGLSAAGYERYEVSSYARGKAYAAHNAGYWLGRPYLGLGMGSHSMAPSFGGASRRTNERSLRKYLADPVTPAAVDRVGAAEHLGERLFLAARTTLGVPWAQLDASRAVEEAWIEMRDRGWLADDDRTLRATQRGLDFGDAIAQRFWEAATVG